MPGIHDRPEVFTPYPSCLQRLGSAIETVELTPNDGRVSCRVLAEQLRDRILQLRQAHGEVGIDLVGFSLGAIVSRYYLQRLGGCAHVERFVSIASPHQGTLVAFGLRNAVGRELRPGSPFLRDLSHDWPQTAARIAVTNLWTPFDLVVLPAWHARLPGSAEVRLPIGRHRWMRSDRRVWESVAKALGGPFPEGPQGLP